MTTSFKNFMKACVKSIGYSLFVIIHLIFLGFMVGKKFIVEASFFYFKYPQILIEIYIKISNFLFFCWNFIFQLKTLKSLRLLSSKNFIKAYFKSTDNPLFVIVCFILFGRMVSKKFIVEASFFYFKYHQILIEIYQNFSYFWPFYWNFILLLRWSKSRRLHLQKKIMKAYFESADSSLFGIIYFLFFWRMVWKNSLRKPVSSVSNIIKFRLKSIKISHISTFFIEISYCNLDNRNHCDYVSKKFYESIYRKCWSFTICNHLFQIFWMHALQKIRCWSLYIFF